jgi:hypothetical protein
MSEKFQGVSEDDLFGKAVVKSLGQWEELMRNDDMGDARTGVLIRLSDKKVPVGTIRKPFNIPYGSDAILRFTKTPECRFLVSISSEEEHISGEFVLYEVLFVDTVFTEFAVVGLKYKNRKSDEDGWSDRDSSMSGLGGLYKAWLSNGFFYDNDNIATDSD